MGSITYNYLTDSIFFYPEYLENDFKDVKINRLRKELEDYRNFCIKNYDTLVKEVDESESSLKVFSSIEKIPFSLLLQTALYIEQFIIYDPLFKLTDTQSEISKVTSKYLGYQQSSLDKQKVSTASNFLKNISPMVAGDFVKVFPLSYHFEAPKNININFPIDHYNGILPEKILDYFREKVTVRSLKQAKNGWIVEDDLYPCRGISIDFEGLDNEVNFIYHLFETSFEDFDEETNKAIIKQTLPDNPPDEDEFISWIVQSINSSSKHVFDKIYLENYIASNLDATYLCDNKFTSGLISKNYETKETLETFTAEELIDIELPFLKNIDVQRLMDIRKNDAEVFTNFRLELEKHFRDLRNIDDPNILKTKKENIFHELNDVQVHRIKMKMEKLKKKAGIDASLFLGGLVGSVQTGGISLLATAIALGKGYKNYENYKEEVHQNPSYLLWKTQI